MAPQLKLTYFNIPGRAELTRLALSCGQIPFEDERIQMSDIAAIKPSLPLGQVPVLSVDGVVYAQSIAIARYAGRLTGLYPNDPLQALRVDMVLDTIAPASKAVAHIRYMKMDEAVVKQKRQEFLEVTAPHTLTGLEKMITGDDFVLDQMSLADLYIFYHIENGIKYCFPDFKLEAYPKVNKIFHNVKNHPGVVEYLAKQEVI